MLKSFSRIMLATCVVVTGFTVSPMVSPAGANQVQLHELLFNRKKRQEFRQRRQGITPQQAAPQPSTQQAAPAPRRTIRRVASESYYTYTVAALSTVTVASLLPDVQTTGSVTQGESSASDETPVVVAAASTEAPPASPSATRFATGTAQAPDGTLSIEGEIADAIRALYADRQDFIWSDGERVSDQGQALIETLGLARAHGLEPAHYAVDLPRLDGTPEDRARALVAFDVALTARAIRYARDLKDGMINPNKLSGYHDFKEERLSADAAAKALASADDAAAWLAGLAPRQQDYRTLQRELAVLAGMANDAVQLPSGIMMRPSATDEALPLVMKAIDRKLRDETRQKHAAAIDSYDGSAVYDAELVELVKDVQRDLGLTPDGIVGPQTAARLGGDSIQSRIDKVAFAMERMRWHPEQYADRHVVINAPEYRVRYMENGETKLAMNAIVGKTSNQTYFFHDQIETVVFNPYWGVPQSIIVNSYLPKLHRDPSYLDRNGFVVTSHSGQRISSSAINWSQYSGPVPFNVRQKPGPRNALGELKILFPNEHAIYMHDTPAKDLFGRDARAFSHGCVRLEDPRAMAAAVLGKDIDYVRSKLGGYETADRLESDVRVYVGYFTAWPNDAGSVSYHPDVYKRDHHLDKAFEAVRSARAG